MAFRGHFDDVDDLLGAAPAPLRRQDTLDVLLDARDAAGHHSHGRGHSRSHSRQSQGPASQTGAPVHQSYNAAPTAAAAAYRHTAPSPSDSSSPPQNSPSRYAAAPYVAASTSAQPVPYDETLGFPGARVPVSDAAFAPYSEGVNPGGQAFSGGQALGAFSNQTGIPNGRSSPQYLATGHATAGPATARSTTSLAGAFAASPGGGGRERTHSAGPVTNASYAGGAYAPGSVGGGTPRGLPTYPSSLSPTHLNAPLVARTPSPTVPGHYHAHARSGSTGGVASSSAVGAVGVGGGGSGAVSFYAHANTSFMSQGGTSADRSQRRQDSSTTLDDVLNSDDDDLGPVKTTLTSVTASYQQRKRGGQAGWSELREQAGVGVSSTPTGMQPPGLPTSPSMAGQTRARASTSPVPNSPAASAAFIRLPSKGGAGVTVSPTHQQQQGPMPPPSASPREQQTPSETPREVASTARGKAHTPLVSARGPATAGGESAGAPQNGSGGLLNIPQLHDNDDDPLDLTAMSSPSRASAAASATAAMSVAAASGQHTPSKSRVPGHSGLSGSPQAAPHTGQSSPRAGVADNHDDPLHLTHDELHHLHNHNNSTNRDDDHDDFGHDDFDGPRENLGGTAKPTRGSPAARSNPDGADDDDTRRRASDAGGVEASLFGQHDDLGQEGAHQPSDDAAVKYRHTRYDTLDRMMGLDSSQGTAPIISATQTAGSLPTLGSTLGGTVNTSAPGPPLPPPMSASALIDPLASTNSTAVAGADLGVTTGHPASTGSSILYPAPSANRPGGESPLPPAQQERSASLGLGADSAVAASGLGGLGGAGGLVAGRGLAAGLSGVSGVSSVIVESPVTANPVSEPSSPFGPRGGTPPLPRPPSATSYRDESIVSGQSGRTSGHGNSGSGGDGGSPTARDRPAREYGQTSPQYQQGQGPVVASYRQPEARSSMSPQYQANLGVGVSGGGSPGQQQGFGIDSRLPRIHVTSESPPLPSGASSAVGAARDDVSMRSTPPIEEVALTVGRSSRQNLHGRSHVAPAPAPTQQVVASSQHQYQQHQQQQPMRTPSHASSMQQDHDQYPHPHQNPHVPGLNLPVRSPNGAQTPMSPQDAPQRTNSGLSTSRTAAAPTLTPRERNPPPAPPLHVKKGKPLGSGAFGDVFLGMNTNTGGLLAVKEVKVTTADENLKKSVERELRIMTRLPDHPNCVRFLGHRWKSNKLLIYMEYLSGGSVAHVLENWFNTGLPESALRRYARMALLGIVHLHEHDIIHQDIKGANVLVDERGNAKIADFGCSKDLSQVTGSVANAGTPLWMAPEVCRSETPATVQSDVWSFGCFILEMAKGDHLPWSNLGKGTTIFAAMWAIGNATRPPPFPKNLSPVCHDFLSKCLAIDPAERWSGDALLEHPFLTEEFMPLHHRGQSAASGWSVDVDDESLSRVSTFHDGSSPQNPSSGSGSKSQNGSGRGHGGARRHNGQNSAASPPALMASIPSQDGDDDGAPLPRGAALASGRGMLKGIAGALQVVDSDESDDEGLGGGGGGLMVGGAPPEAGLGGLAAGELYGVQESMDGGQAEEFYAAAAASRRGDPPRNPNAAGNNTDAAARDGSNPDGAAQVEVPLPPPPPPLMETGGGSFVLMKEKRQHASHHPQAPPPVPPGGRGHAGGVDDVGLGDIDVLLSSSPQHDNAPLGQRGPTHGQPAGGPQGHHGRPPIAYQPQVPTDSRRTSGQSLYSGVSGVSGASGGQGGLNLLGGHALPGGHQRSLSAPEDDARDDFQFRGRPRAQSSPPVTPRAAQAADPHVGPPPSAQAEAGAHAHAAQPPPSATWKSGGSGIGGVTPHGDYYVLSQLGSSGPGSGSTNASGVLSPEQRRGTKPVGGSGKRGSSSSGMLSRLFEK